MMTLKEFHTDRVRFRELIEDDREPLRRIVDNERFNFAGLQNKDDVDVFLEKARARQTEQDASGIRTGFRLAATAKDDGTFIGFGSIGIAELKERGQIRDIGYFVAPDAWGQGLGKEIAYALCYMGFAYYGLDVIWATVSSDNRWSKDVLTCIGMTMGGEDIAAFGTPPRLCVRQVYKVGRHALKQPFAAPVGVTFAMEA